MVKGFLYIEAQTYLSVKLTFHLTLELVESCLRIEKIRFQDRGKIRNKNFNQRNKRGTFEE